MPKPIIIITAGTMAMSTATIAGVDVEYLVAVSLAGGVPVLLPPMADREGIEAVTSVADGLLLTGGGDIHAEFYGEELHPESHRHDIDRDNMEMEVARRALALNMPILGICRGMQLLNVVHGGTLVQDIASQLPGALPHNAHEAETFYHPIVLESDSLLARIMHTAEMQVNSWHHQAICELGTGLRIAAHAGDGVIEAIESAAGAPVLAVQCHPEACTETYPCYRTLFHWLIDEAEAYRHRCRA